MEDLSRKRVRDDSECPSHALSEVKRLREDLLGFFEDSLPEPATQDLDSVIRSLEEEILPETYSSVPVVDLTSESQPHLGYLLEASDDELGLPPPQSEGVPADDDRVVPDDSGIGRYWGFDEQFPGYDSFGLGTGDNYTWDDDYVALGGLFEYPDVVLDFSWRHETLPAQ